MRLHKLSGIGLAAVVVLAAGPALAVPIAGLYNTGQSNDGTFDLAYELTVVPLGSGITVPSQPYLLNTIPGVWVAGDWIGVINDNANVSGTPSDPEGIYVYTLTFDLTGLDPASAVITGQWTSDNDSAIFLNGVGTGFTRPFSGFGSLGSFTLSTGFVSGLNVLEFQVNNGAGGSTGNPTGLLVTDLAGTANAVPEPGTLLLLGSGISALALRRRKS